MDPDSVPIAINPQRIMQHVRHLALKIGPRLAGSPQEQQAADYITRQMQRIGLQGVHQQPFTCKWYDVHEASLEARFGRRWQPVTMDAVAHTPCTPGEIEAELVYVESATDDILRGVDLRGKVALVHGTYGSNIRMLQRFQEQQVAAVIWTDVRYTGDWNVVVGLPWSFLPWFTFPAASVPHPVAWELVRQGVKRVRLNLQTVVEDRPSQNVIGELPGKTDRGGVLICGHHDSVRGTCGAEDNAAGVGCMLAVAEALADLEPNRPVKFVSFGTEEQLSQGAFTYVEHTAYGADTLDLVLNIDGQGCWTGINEIYLTGSPSLHEYMRRQMMAHGWSAVIRDEPDAFSDHFPFTIKGVPAAWFCRRNCAGGRWFHHSVYETIEVLDPANLAHCASLCANIAREVATSAQVPFVRRLPPATRRAVQEVADNWLPEGCWG